MRAALQRRGLRARLPDLQADEWRAWSSGVEGAPMSPILRLADAEAEERRDMERRQRDWNREGYRRVM